MTSLDLKEKERCSNIANLNEGNIKVVEEILELAMAKICGKDVNVDEVASKLFADDMYMIYFDYVYQLINTHPRELPKSFDKENFLKKYKLYNALLSVYSLSFELLESVKNNLTDLGESSFNDSMILFLEDNANKGRVISSFKKLQKACAIF